MDYSLNERELKFAGDEEKKQFVATLVCQKEHIAFDRLCALMAEDSTVGEADIAAVFTKRARWCTSFVRRVTSWTPVRWARSARRFSRRR